MTEHRHDISAVAPGLPNAGCPLPGIATAGQPNEAQLAALAAAGYRVVLDLRAPEEPRGFDEAAAVRRTGMEYIALPVTLERLDDSVFEQFRTLLREPGRQPMLVHCASANRVGALLLPYLILDEKRPPEDAMEIAMRVGLRSPELAQIALAYTQRQRT